jgi:hypothetical protein
MEKISSYLKTVLRWILAPIVSLIAYMLIYMLLNLMSFFIPFFSSDGIVIKYIYKAPISFVSGYLAIHFGVMLVKSHQKYAAILSALFLTFYFLFSSLLFPQPSSRTLLEIQITGLFSIIGFVSGAIWRDALFVNQDNK